jgi:hypothetical protein
MRKRQAMPRVTNRARASLLAQLRQQQRQRINWASVDAVVGTREDLSRSGIKHPCQGCGLDVYTGAFPYPEGISYLCEVCAATGVEAQPDDHAVKR